MIDPRRGSTSSEETEISATTTCGRPDARTARIDCRTMIDRIRCAAEPGPNDRDEREEIFPMPALMMKGTA